MVVRIAVSNKGNDWSMWVLRRIYEGGSAVMGLRSMWTPPTRVVEDRSSFSYQTASSAERVRYAEGRSGDTFVCVSSVRVWEILERIKSFVVLRQR